MLFKIINKIKEDRRNYINTTKMTISSEDVNMRKVKKYLKYRGYKVKSKYECCRDLETGHIEYTYWILNIK